MSSGYNTYIVAALIGIVSTLHALGYITDEAFTTILGLLNGGGLLFLRAGMKSGK